MTLNDSGRAVDRLREHLSDGVTCLNSLSESFSIFAYEAIRDRLADVDLRLLLHDQSLAQYPLNGLEAENVQRARLDQHRIARSFTAWAEGHVHARALTRRTRGTWTSTDGPSPYLVDGAGLDAESLALVPSQSLFFPQESTDNATVAQSTLNFERMWFDNATSRDVQAAFLGAARALFRDRAPDDVYLRILTSLFKDFIDESGGEATGRGRTGFYDSSFGASSSGSSGTASSAPSGSLSGTTAASSPTAWACVPAAAGRSPGSRRSSAAGGSAAAGAGWPPG